MPRVERVDVANQIYHILNRANAHVQIFDTDEDYKLFEDILEEAAETYGMRILAYCLMPNHWHLVLYPHKDGDLQKFMSLITNTHTRRWHTAKETIGQGHLYQGRYKSFLCEKNNHFLILVRYVERNAKKANLVRYAEKWRWGSAWRREHGTKSQKKMLTNWPVPRPQDYLSFLNQPQTQSEEEAIERSLEKNIPYGGDQWVSGIVKKYGLEQTLRSVGRPRKNGG
ncbi:MAG: transposase [Minisyncoccia bacterium]